MGYLDYIIIFSKTEEEHLQHLEDNIWMTMESRAQTETTEMLFLQEAH